MSGGWGYRGRKTSAESQRKGDVAESQELMEAGESEEGRPQRRVMNGWKLASRMKGDLSGESGMGNGWGVGGRETSAESQEWVEAGESEEGRPQRRVRNGWRLGSRRKGDLSGESGESGMGGGWEVGMGGGWGVGGRETSVESQEWVKAGESEEGRPQQRVRNGWRLGSQRKGDLSVESGMGGGWGFGRRETSAEHQEWVKAGESEEGRPQWRGRNGWRLGSRRKGHLSGEAGMGGGWGVGGRETSPESQEWVEAGEAEEWRPERRVRNG
ncbi:hypothetical protein NDU88_001001 [Pleurodeles waltl]|uniref:Uncharacterized protein n=1 Tax=Pleurodeles waltl TaxID=8319 RepID=A0AAV7KQC6_PLEWA|nr:hypothetical protein NDU88_001001 [Pleurodeles waltl]